VTCVNVAIYKETFWEVLAMNDKPKAFYFCA